MIIFVAASTLPPFQCEFHNNDTCLTPPCNTTETCEIPEEGKRSHCFALWHNTTTGGIELKLKGCWLDMEDCYDEYVNIITDEICVKDLPYALSGYGSG